MTHEIVSVLKNALGRWVCWKDTSAHPALLAVSDFHDLAVAAQAGRSETALPDGEREWGDLRALTKSWLVQKDLGVAPEPLQTSDFEQLAALISPSLSENSPVQPAMDESEIDVSGVHGREGDAAPPHVALWTREAPELSFAREHLERCL
ncbi:hypothetical protein [Gluconobacter kanchanaburiensis]|uniref:Uncharacterized protein n=1 Tax=Gluconobacter kanchanaburiensis NBRC 103587 TaxID=1307948 RepID=A0A511B8M7_9PROT|nr:hypothetical protein [Gluconobacter kanchanaburiensis]MBF0862063.1 hypothetical protein [Gluconobacter kanchanaburiensis]GBR71128.1 hypothetical protein AA103587_2239 [Gluconobacter kanchanaburiensis NBRC 103587]GEK96805.1 hypothetical protein GKA01_20020 [Gluconobacter kanchanaburiensis NBRC 103587]